MNGSSVYGQTAIYGTMGIPDINNTPGGRECYAKWKGNNNDLWVFGGRGWGTGFGLRNDLWKYDIVNNEWTWMSGDSTSADSVSISESQCISSIYNIPSVRFENRACWNLGGRNFITFGGFFLFNDLWNYNVSNNEWTLLKGSVTPYLSSIHGIKYVSNISNTPGGRGGSIAWSDSSCNLWLFGGYDTTGTWNDMWRFTLDNSCPTESFYCSDAGLGILESNSPKGNVIFIYPNPCSSTLTLSTPSTNLLSSITIYSTDGRKLREEVFSSHSEKVQLNLSALAAGVYFLDCAGEKGREMVKVVKY
jgi:hypothetical protein